MSQRLAARDLAYSGVFGAAALLLPVLFHVVHLGHVFMPMYLPLLALAFFVRPLPAATTAFVTPLLSGVVSGMPPFFPPVAVCMAIELAVMTASISAVTHKWSRINEWIVLVPALLLGRIVHVGLVYLIALWIELPAGFLAGVSLIAGWPGMVLMTLVVPVIAKTGRNAARQRLQDG